MRKSHWGMVVAFGVMSATAGQAQVTQTLGAGTAVTTAQATASFESVAALNDNPYVENGLSFTRTNLTFNNNGCGFAGCAGHPGFVGFSGNYMYGTGSGFFSIFAPGGQLFRGLEFMVGTGFPQSTTSVFWEAYSGGGLVGSGSLSANVGDVVGFASVSGFDELRYTDVGVGSGAPAFDSVRAQFDGAILATPEPATVALMASGLAVVGGLVRRRRTMA